MIVHVTPRPNWQNIIQRAGFALSQHGINIECREVQKAAELAGVLRTDRPRAVFVHAFSVGAKLVIDQARANPQTTFIVTCHSEENHLFTWPQFFLEVRDLLHAGRELQNLILAGSTSEPWQALGRDVRRWKCPCILPTWTPPPEVKPETVLITSRADIVKALPSQIMAAAILQRQRGVRVAIAINGSEDRKNGLRALCEATGLKADWWPWVGADEFIRRLREDVSIVLQPSMTETFNYVSWEAGSVGRPWVGSAAIDHTPPAWRANPNDPLDIARVAVEILDGYPAASQQAREIAESVAKRNNRAYADLIRGLI